MEIYLYSSGHLTAQVISHMFSPTDQLIHVQQKQMRVFLTGHNSWKMTMNESKELLNVEQDMPKKNVLKDLASKANIITSSVSHSFL